MQVFPPMTICVFPWFNWSEKLPFEVWLKLGMDFWFFPQGEWNSEPKETSVSKAPALWKIHRSGHQQVRDRLLRIWLCFLLFGFGLFAIWPFESISGFKLSSYGFHKVTVYWSVLSFDSHSPLFREKLFPIDPKYFLHIEIFSSLWVWWSTSAVFPSLSSCFSSLKGTQAYQDSPQFLLWFHVCRLSSQQTFLMEISRVLPTLPVAVKSTRTSRGCVRRAQQPVFALKQFLLKNWWNSLVFLGRCKTHSYIMLKSSTLFASISAFFVCSSKSRFLTTAELGLLLYLNCRLPWFSLPMCELSESHRTMLLEGVSGNLLYGVLVILQHMRVCM